MNTELEIVWSPESILHIWERHGITPDEVEQACYGRILIRRTREKRCLVYGRTEAGRYLLVVGVMQGRNQLFVITAREMTRKERRYYVRGGK